MLRANFEHCAKVQVVIRLESTAAGRSGWLKRKKVRTIQILTNQKLLSSQFGGLDLLSIFNQPVVGAAWDQRFPFVQTDFHTAVFLTSGKF